MNRRRMMMEEHKVLPLYVFEYGKNGLSYGEVSSSKGATFTGGRIKVTASGNGGYINIGGIDFSKYKKLNIRCYADITDYDTYYYVNYTGYGESEEDQEIGYTALQYAPKFEQVLSFDIGKVKGEKIIKATADHNGTAVMYIKNIWME